MTRKDKTLYRNLDTTALVAACTRLERQAADLEEVLTFIKAELDRRGA